MIYRVVKKGEPVLIGAVDAEALEKKLQEYLDNGFTVSTMEEYLPLVLKGAANTGE